MNGNRFYLSSSPHFTLGNSTQKIMLTVIVALLPECIWGIVMFGLKALISILKKIRPGKISGNILFGLGQGADDEETISYTPFANDNVYVPNNNMIMNGFNPHSMMNVMSNYGENKKYQYANRIGKVIGNKIAVN